ncbi:MAG: DUF2934 domain-containing protein [Gammaproteobacteria bacterium]|nr:DUF2934 domain-containing protein [Gammaproteobacteria bacterium]NNJ97375.1 DUF2934 domain-containing protein [Gammaproteobacteria bacterium]
MTKSSSKTTTSKAATKKVAKKKVTKKKITTKKVAKKTVAKKAPVKKAPVKKAAATKTAAPKPTKTTISADERRMMVAVHAYYKWQKAGFPTGDDFNHWLEAEREIEDMLK